MVILGIISGKKLQCIRDFWYEEHVKRHKLFVIYLYVFEQTELKRVTSDTSVKIANLPHALQLMDEWETDLSVPAEENTAYIAHLSEENCTKFPDLMVNKILNSKVFIYPNLLPRVPFSEKSMVGCYQFIHAED